MGHALKLALGIVLVVVGIGWGGATPVSAGELTPATRELFDAVRANNLSAVRRSLLKGGDVTAENALGLTAVDLAVDKGYFPIAHYLLAWRKQRAPKIQPLIAQVPSIHKHPPRGGPQQGVQVLDQGALSGSDGPH